MGKHIDLRQSIYTNCAIFFGPASSQHYNSGGGGGGGSPGKK